MGGVGSCVGPVTLAGQVPWRGIGGGSEEGPCGVAETAPLALSSSRPERHCGGLSLCSALAVGSIGERRGRG